MLSLMYITNDPNIALIAQRSGVDRIFLDMEHIGKAERQCGMDTVVSTHTVDDIKTIRKAVSESEVLVRCNSIFDGSKEEIDAIVESGADIIMLPYFKTVEEVERFIGFVNGRAKTCLLIETPEIVDQIDDILCLKGIDEAHIGINDLSIGYHKKFLFEVLADGTVDYLCGKLKQKGIPYGFGGIASLGCGLLSSEHVIMEHYRLGSTRAILSRSFCDTKKIRDLNAVNAVFRNGVKAIREYEDYCRDHCEKWEANKIETQKIIRQIALGKCCDPE